MLISLFQVGEIERCHPFHSLLKRPQLTTFNILVVESPSNTSLEFPRQAVVLVIDRSKAAGAVLYAQRFLNRLDLLESTYIEEIFMHKWR